MIYVRKTFGNLDIIHRENDKGSFEPYLARFLSADDLRARLWQPFKFRMIDRGWNPASGKRREFYLDRSWANAREHGSVHGFESCWRTWSSQGKVTKLVYPSEAHFHAEFLFPTKIEEARFIEENFMDFI